jgi:hypothetical protein
MSSKKQVKQSLELTLSLAESLGPLTRSEAKEFFGLLGELNKVFSKVVDPDAHGLKPEPSPEVVKHPIDALLKKGKVELPEGRYKQLIQIHDELLVLKIKFLSAKQNQNVTWFPLEWNGDKSAALYLSSSEWSIAPIKYRDDNDLTGEWEGFDLTEFMSMNCPEFDQDEY